MLLAAGIAAIPAIASADVLEIGESGPQWVSGGPAMSAPQIVGADVAEAGFASQAPSGGDNETSVGQSAIDALLHPQSLTEVMDAAGPMRWRERVARIAAKYDISPTLLEAVVWQESRWNELALSPAGARGLAQLMPGTARQMGVNADDPLANLEGGARYLRMQLDAFDGNIEKALAAYNAGPGRVVAAGGIPRIRETQAYVASIMARLTDPVRQ